MPEHNPVDTSDVLSKDLRDQNHATDVLLRFAGMYTARSEWMDGDVASARRIDNSIIGVPPWGNVQILPWCNGTPTRS